MCLYDNIWIKRLFIFTKGDILCSWNRVTGPVVGLQPTEYSAANTNPAWNLKCRSNKNILNEWIHTREFHISFLPIDPHKCRTPDFKATLWRWLGAMFLWVGTCFVCAYIELLACTQCTNALPLLVVWSSVAEIQQCANKNREEENL